MSRRLHDPRGIWVKIDGITRPEDTHAAAEAGVSAVGLIFAPSPRLLTVEGAMTVRAAIPEGVLCFGVFDASSAAFVRQTTEELSLDGVQFPAELDPDAETVPSTGVVVLRTVRVRAADDLGCLDELRCDAVHLDAYSEGQLGGTGQLAPWDVIASVRPSIPFVLSGGLRPDNVGDAVERLRPAGVDVSSGVESAPGIKDHEKMRAFVQAARVAAR